MLRSLFCLALLSISLGVGGQSSPSESITLVYAVFSNGFGTPFTNHAPLHPGIEFGRQIGPIKGDRWSRAWFAYVGGYYHAYVQTAVYLRGEYLIGYRLGKYWRAELPLSLGYKHRFFDGKLYEPDGTGGFERVAATGRPSVIGGSGLGISYVLTERFSCFLRNDVVVSGPFANGIPVILQNQLKVGLRHRL